MINWTCFSRNNARLVAILREWNELAYLEEIRSFPLKAKGHHFLCNIQWKLHNVITCGQTESDNINQILTISNLLVTQLT